MNSENDDVISTENGVDIDGDMRAEVADRTDNGDNGGEVADSATNNGSDVNDPEVAAPGDMSDIEFEEYISGIESGLITDEPDNPSVSKADSSLYTREPADSDESESIPDEPESNQNNEPYKVFSSKEEYQAEFDRIFNNRHRDYAQSKALNDDLTNELMDFYGVDDRDTAVQKFKEQMNRRKAEERGMSEDEYKEHSDMERKAKAYDAYAKQQQAVQSLRNRLFAEADQIRQTDSGFDLQAVYDSDSDFKADLDRTGSVYLAYANKTKRDAAKPQQKKVTTVAPAQKQQKQRVFREGALSTSASGRVNTSPADLSDEEFEKYIENIKNQ